MAKTVLFPLRLAPEVDQSLRAHIDRRGALVALITTILESVDLGRVAERELSLDQDNVSTSVKLPVHLHTKLKRTAASRSLSMNALVNCAIWEYTHSVQRPAN